MVEQSSFDSGHVLAGRYRVVRGLGKGGMGEVFEVEHTENGRRLAMKTLLPGFAGHREIVLRFEREAKAASLLDHPGIVETLDFGTLPGGTLYLVMELCEGRPLGTLIDQERLPAERALAIARGIVAALAHAHAAGVIHRDIKADNVMVRRGDGGADEVKLLDFGIAKVVGEAAAAVGQEKLTRAGIVFGTPDYMAPEQALGQEVDHRADIYSVGVLLFEMLTGRQPFVHDSAAEVTRMQILAPPPTLAQVAPRRRFTPALEALVARAMAKRREDRFATADDLLAAIDAATADLREPPPPPLPPPPLPPPPLPPPPVPLAPPWATRQAAQRAAERRRLWVVAGVLATALFVTILIAIAST